MGNNIKNYSMNAAMQALNILRGIATNDAIGASKLIPGAYGTEEIGFPDPNNPQFINKQLEESVFGHLMRTTPMGGNYLPNTQFRPLQPYMQTPVVQGVGTPQFNNLQQRGGQ